MEECYYLYTRTDIEHRGNVRYCAWLAWIGYTKGTLKRNPSQDIQRQGYLCEACAKRTSAYFLLERKSMTNGKQ